MGVFEIYCDRCGLPFRPLQASFLPKKVQDTLTTGYLEDDTTKHKRYVKNYDTYGTFLNSRRNRRVDATGAVDGRDFKVNHRHCHKFFKKLSSIDRKILEEHMQGQVFDDKKYINSGLFKIQFKFDAAPSVKRHFT
tara:strand:+ start:235 stop:642 length:408 start_codon:yes stop_codon:yes gene_type:complete